MLEPRGNEREFPISVTDWEAAQLNILPTTRIGWETKQQYLHQLIDAYSNGYLDEDTFNNRKQWIEQALTKEQVELAVKDLPVLRITGLELAPHLQPKKTKTRPDARMPFTLFTIDSVFAGINALTGNPAFFVFTSLAALMLIITVVSVRR